MCATWACESTCPKPGGWGYSDLVWVGKCHWEFGSRTHTYTTFLEKKLTHLYIYFSTQFSDPKLPSFPKLFAFCEEFLIKFTLFVEICTHLAQMSENVKMDPFIYQNLNKNEWLLYQWYWFATHVCSTSQYPLLYQVAPSTNLCLYSNTSKSIECEAIASKKANEFKCHVFGSFHYHPYVRKVSYDTNPGVTHIPKWYACLS